eukprot:scaffold7774_cov88-Skeletonema_dohrnii-CCMP3373.AAC.4
MSQRLCFVSDDKKWSKIRHLSRLGSSNNNCLGYTLPSCVESLLDKRAVGWRHFCCCVLARGEEQYDYFCQEV